MRQDIDKQSSEIIFLLNEYPEGVSLSGIFDKLDYTFSIRTLQRRLSKLASQGIINRVGQNRGAKYFLSADYGIRQESEELRHGDEGIRQEDEELRQGDEGIRQEDEELRQGDESIRQESEESRQGDEDIRQEDKELRHGDEDTRQESEELRHGDEDIRQESEELRQGDEGIRQELPVRTIFSEESKKILRFLETPPYARSPVSYNREFLENYIPNETQYVRDDLKRELMEKGRRFDKELAIGTYAKQILQRLLIDLSYNSSRLEGNTYSDLETKKLLEGGVTPEGKNPEETTMIINHKEAIKFIVDNAEAIKVDSFTIFNIHSLLSQDLLFNPKAKGQIREIEVEISNSRYVPLSNTYILRELFEILLLKANAIKDPFEQSFFLIVHVAYLQAFEDVNKRTSRLSCNIPFIKHNLCPISFINLSRKDYTSAILAVYELNDLNPMLNVFRWAYLQSCNQYRAVKNSKGEIDFYRVRYRAMRKEVLGNIVRRKKHGSDIDAYVQDFSSKNSVENPEKFLRIIREEAEFLHEGSIVGLNISIDQFRAWVRDRN